MHPVLQALIATCFTWALTALGAAFVFLLKEPSKKLLDAMLGFAAGVMLAASYWSLLAPAIELSSEIGAIPWLPALVGFLLGGITIRVLDRVLPHLHLKAPLNKREGVKTSWSKTTLLVLAITLHNIPEGLAVGVAFGAAAAGLKGYTTITAIVLAIGIGIQNFPEGLAVSFPLRRENVSVKKSFFYGQLSAVVEPIAGVIGAAIAISARAILPYALAFAAGAMIFVVVEEVIPEAEEENPDIATMGALLGFAVMMLLDVALG
jgi:ZIP family zinc transporter